MPAPTTEEAEAHTLAVRALTPLDREPRALLPTNEAALHLGRQPQTLRRWAAFGDGPIRPARVAGRLGWRTTDLRRLLDVEAAQ